MKNRVGKAIAWSERFTKTDTRYLLKGGFWLGLGRGLSILLSLGLAVAFANLLDPKEYGVYKFVLSLAGFLWAFTLTGLPAAITRAVAQGHEGMLPKAIKSQMRWSTIVTISALAISLYYFYNDNQTLGTAMLLVGAFSPFIKTYEMFGSYLSGKQAFKIKTFFGVLRDSIPTAALIGALFFTNDPVLLIATYFVSHTFAAGLFYFITLKKFPPNDTDDETVTKDGKHLSLMNIIGKAAAEVDKILLFHHLGAAPLALYAFAYAPVQQMQGFGTLIQTLLAAKLPSRSFEELKRSIPWKTFLAFLITIPIVGAYVAAAPYIYTYLFPQYVEGVIFSQALALSLLVAFPSILLRESFIATRKLFPLYVTKTVVPILRVLLLLFLIPTMGIWGAVIALVIPQVLNLILLSLFFLFIKS